MVALRSAAPNTLVKLLEMPIPRAGVPAGVKGVAMVVGKLLLPIKPVKSVGSDRAETSRPVSHSAPNWRKAGLEMVTKRASIKTCWIGLSNSRMIRSITSSCSGVPLATTKFRS